MLWQASPLTCITGYKHIHLPSATTAKFDGNQTDNIWQFWGEQPVQ